jgi:hypothetical protein
MRHCKRLAFLLAMTGLLGCGEGSRRFEYVLIKGKVTLDGKPLALKSVCLHPEECTSGLGAQGLTAEDGSVNLVAVVGGATEVIKGAIPGRYRVTISDIELEAGSPQDLQASQPRKPTIAIPSVYSSVDTTPVRLEVAPDMNDVVIELKSKGR